MFNSTDRTIGYNISVGGTGGNHYYKTLSDSEKKKHNEKISKARKETYTKEKEEQLRKGRRRFWENVDEAWIKRRAEKNYKSYVCVDLKEKAVFKTDRLKEFCSDNFTSPKSRYQRLISCSTGANYQSVSSGWCCFLDTGLTDLGYVKKSEYILQKYRVENSEAHKVAGKKRCGSNNPKAKKYIFISPTGIKVIFDGCFKNKCKEATGYSNVTMYKLINKEINEYKGWKIA